MRRKDARSRRVLTRVEDVASVRARAGGGARVANATALAPLGDGRAGGGGDGGGGRRGGRGRAGGGGARAAGAGRAAEGGADVAPLDVRVHDGRVGDLRLDVGGDAGGRGARAAGDAGRGRVLVRGVVRVEPEHARGVVVPDGEREDHAGAREGLAELLEAALLVEDVGVAERGLLLRAEVLGDRVDAVDAGDLRERVLDDLAALHVDAADLGEGTGGRVVGGQELRDDREGLARVDGHALAEESGVTHAVRVEVTAVAVAHASVARAVSARATSLRDSSARVGSEGSRIVVGLPNCDTQVSKRRVA